MKKHMQYVWLYSGGEPCRICEGFWMSPEEIAEAHGPGSGSFPGRIALLVTE